jgi:tetratricopeptide (TPR) repeat protein
LKTIRLVFVLLAVLETQSLWAASDTTPSLFSLTYYELYGTPVEPLNYAQTITDALGFDILAEYNPSYYASIGLNFEKTSFYDGYNTTASFLGLETRFFGAPNGKNPFSPYIYGGVGLGLNTGTGNQLKAGLGSRIQLFPPIMFLDFSAGSNWIDSGLQYLNFRGGLSLSFDLPKVEPAPTAVPTIAKTPLVTPTVTVVSTIADVLASPTITATPFATSTPTITLTATEMATSTIIVTSVSTLTPVLDMSRVKIYYIAGMKSFEAHRDLAAITDFKKAIAVNEPTAKYYYYAESNAMLGVIYQFRLTKVENHNKLAVKYYKRALKIDPGTKSAKKFLAMLQGKKPSGKKRAALETPTSVSTATSMVVDQPTAVTAQQPAVHIRPAVSTQTN